MIIDRYDYDITYDNENGRYEVEAIKCDDGAMISFEHYEKQAQELEAKDKRIAELNADVLALSGKDLSTALKLTKRIDKIVEAGNGLIYNDSGAAPLYQPAIDKWNAVLSNTKGEG